MYYRIGSKTGALLQWKMTEALNDLGQHSIDLRIDGLRDEFMLLKGQLRLWIDGAHRHRRWHT